MSNYENFDEQKKFACRVIADHARSTAFAIADGILPGNEGRNYVLRKIMRRAIYHGREHLGFDKLFFHKVCGFVVEQMKAAYPELAVQKDFIDKMVRLEEERFGNTLTVGLKKLNAIINNINDAKAKMEVAFANPNEESDAKLVPIPSSADIAVLNDTYGMPVDLAYVVLSQNNVVLMDKIYVNGEAKIRRSIVSELSEEEFKLLIGESIKSLQANSEIGKTKQAEKINPLYSFIFDQIGEKNNEFLGYETTTVENAYVLGLVRGDSIVGELVEGKEGWVILDKTPFYAESGGQVGDTGTLTTNSGGVIKVLDTFSPIKGLIIHKVKVEKGKIRSFEPSFGIGQVPNSEPNKLDGSNYVTASVDVEKRDATRRNHTATHLVHAALREVLGTHVKQGGSVVAPNYLRFDFTHYQPLSEVEIKEVEDLVNYQILQNEKVSTDLMSIEDAMRTGAMALFGEKYGEKVRVLSVGNGEFSRELCGGTHVRATGDIGSFKITNDEAIASGVRRIRAITGFDSFARFREGEKLITDSLNVLKTQRDNLPNAIEKLQEELKKTRKEIDDLKMKIATGAIGGASANGDEAKVINGVNVVAKTVDGLDKGGMRHLSDTLMAKMKSGVVILARTEEEKVSFIVRVSDDLTGKVSAGNIVREISPIVGGRGGGKADMAEGGGTDASKLNEAIEASYKVIENMLG